MKNSRARAYMWRQQDRVTIRQAAEVLGVDTIRAREIYDQAMIERLGSDR